MSYAINHSNNFTKLFCQCIGCRNWRKAAEQERLKREAMTDKLRDSIANSGDT